MLAYVLLSLSSACILYTLAVYPALMAWFFRRSVRPVRKNPKFRPTVSVVLAVHNGQQFIRQKLHALLSQDYPRELLQIIVISDGSTDATDDIVESFEDRGIRLLRVIRGGKAAALNAALPHLTGDVVFLTDVRQELPSDTLAELVANFADRTVGAVTGEPRFVTADPAPQESDLGLYWRYELWMRRRHSEIGSACNTTGWIYAIRRELVQPIPPDTLTDDGVIPLRVLCTGYRVIVEPQALAFESAKIATGEFRRKLRTLAGLWQIHRRMPELFTSRNPMRFHFFSHKSTRLLLPWALLTAWLGVILLPSSPLQRALVLAPLVAVTVAILDFVVPRHSRLKRISSPPRTFLTMNLASLLSPVVFIVPPAILWPPTEAVPAGAPLENTPSVVKMRS
jgi:biofilm PGA synthesis N-glycosyltransferase PgaC